MIRKPDILSDEEIKATSPTAPWYVGCVQCASRIAQAQREEDIKHYEEMLGQFREAFLDDIATMARRFPTAKELTDFINKWQDLQAQLEKEVNDG